MVSKELAGVRIDYELSYEDVLKRIDELVTSGTHYVWTLNPEFVMDAQKDLEFKNLLNESALSVADGAGLLFARRYLDKVSEFKKGFLGPCKAFIYGTFMGLSSVFNPSKLGSRITGEELIYKICENAEKQDQTVLFLGGWLKDSFGRRLPESGQVAERTAQVLKGMYPNLKVVAASSDFRRDLSDDARTLDFIHGKMKESGVGHVDIVFVAYNHIHQEKWLKRNLRQIPGRVGIGVGGTFDYVTGAQKKSPNSATRINLGWLYRLFTQPWRLGRILKAFPVFPLFVYLLAARKHKTS